MFQFTTTTVINSNVDSSGKELFKGFEADTKNKMPQGMLVRRGLKFFKPNVVEINTREYSAPKLAMASLDMASIEGTGNFRIAMYIKLSQGSANSYYANSLGNGKPLYVEFTKKNGEDAAAIAKKVMDTIKNYSLAVYDTELVKVSVTGTKLIITAVDEYQIFSKIDIEQYNSTTKMFEVVKSAEIVDKADTNLSGKFIIEKGKEGFGTYQYILKNLRLPTAANTSWGSINADEVPVIGAKYDEYVIKYQTDRGVLGGSAVGEKVTSITTHVFYVNQNVKTEFETAIAKITPGTVQSTPTTVQSTPTTVSE